jgi:hypothetical protein
MRPEHPGTTIRTLKGVVPVAVSTRKPDPLVVPLASAAGRTYRNDDATVVVHEVRTRPDNRPPGIDLTVRPTSPGAGAGAAGGEPEAIAALRPDSFQHQIEVIDAQGRPIPWYQSAYDAETGRMTLTVTAPEQAAAVVELRFFSLVRASADVPFEFHNLPLP